uniref:Uncharacterized protein n=1 Tax=Anopheles atroparvus TaxID=41427 RepID=A0A182J2J2_ANOAO
MPPPTGPPSVRAALASSAGIPPFSNLLSGATSGVEERLMVTVRVRPLSDAGEPNCIQVQPNRSRSLLFDDGSRNKPKKYNYDCVFGEVSTQCSEGNLRLTSGVGKDDLDQERHPGAPGSVEKYSIPHSSSVARSPVLSV